MVIYNEAILDQLGAWLASAGYESTLTDNSIDGLRSLSGASHDVVIVDAALPQMDGYEFCQIAIKLTQAPVILIGRLASEDDIVRSLKVGASEYIVEPVGKDEFLARVAAIVHIGSQREPSSILDRVYKDDFLTVNKDAESVWIRGKRTDITPIPFKLLSFLVWHADKNCSTNEILRGVWEEPRPPAGVVRWQISRLRAKIERDPRNPERIITVHGIGYRYAG